jgi:DNA-binding NtrC family response regulator
MMPHLLLIDDEAAIRELYNLYFISQGFEITTASNAIQALHIIYERRFDAILVDLGLGDSNGMDLIEPIKNSQPDVPILIFTGMTIEAELRRTVSERGAFGILRKSFPLNYVTDEIRRAIQVSRRAQGTG